MTNRDMEIIKGLLEGCSKEEIIEVFEGVLINLNKKMDGLIETLVKTQVEAVTNAKQYEELMEHTKTLENLLAISLGVNMDDVVDEEEDECSICPFDGVCKNTHYPCKEDKEDIYTSQLGRKPKAVYVYNPETGFSDIFMSLQKASEVLKVSIGGLSEVANGKRESIRGYKVIFI